jgi:hypothetical protein
MSGKTPSICVPLNQGDSIAAIKVAMNSSVEECWKLNEGSNEGFN